MSSNVGEAWGFIIRPFYIQFHFLRRLSQVRRSLTDLVVPIGLSTLSPPHKKGPRNFIIPEPIVQFELGHFRAVKSPNMTAHNCTGFARVPSYGSTALTVRCV